jgi:hypothetical protein
VAAVADSIKEYGYVSPIVIDAKGVIIAGHTRYRALLSLGIYEIECIVSDMSEQKARGYRIIDNKTSELAGWNDEKLIAEIQAAQLTKFEIHFPEIKIEEINLPAVGSLSTQSHLVTPTQIAASSDRQNDRFTETAQYKADQIKTMTCPHCGQEFDTN